VVISAGITKLGSVKLNIVLQRCLSLCDGVVHAALTRDCTSILHVILFTPFVNPGFFSNQPSTFPCFFTLLKFKGRVVQAASTTGLGTYFVDFRCWTSFLLLIYFIQIIAFLIFIADGEFERHIILATFSTHNLTVRHDAFFLA